MLWSQPPPRPRPTRWSLPRDMSSLCGRSFHWSRCSGVRVTTPFSTPVDAAVDSDQLRPPSDPSVEPWWDKTISSLRGELNEATWVTWFAAVQPVELTHDVLTVSVPSTLVRDRIQSNYAGMLKDAVRLVTGIAVEIDIVVRTEPRKEQVLDVTDDAVAKNRLDTAAPIAKASGPKGRTAPT